jgi:hypothetical protein
MEEKEKPRNRFNLFLGILVTIYGIVATLVSYQSSQLNDDASNMTFVGIMELTKGNDAYAAADNFVTADYDAITQMFLLWERDGSDAEVQIWQDTLTQDAQDAMDRSGDLDDIYYEDAYANANDLYDNAELAYQTAQDYLEIANDYDLVTLLLALGLAFTAWASLLENLKLVRFIFSGMSVLILAVSLFIYWGAASTILPPAVVPLG